MIEPLLDLPPHLRERLASALESGLLPWPPSPSALRSVLGGVAAIEGAARGLGELRDFGLWGPSAAMWIRTVSRLENQARRTDLVWSGPEVPGLHARDTLRVYEELLGSARRTLWVSTFVFFDGPRVFGTLARRMDEVPGLQVTLLLNIQRHRGDTSNTEQLVRRFADRFWQREWPGAVRPTVFYDPRALDPDIPSGVLHAKAVVVDDQTVFVTSANLTEAAQNRNIELGLLVRDPPLAASVSAHFRGLIDRGILLPLPLE